jgi:hypothetical protein
MRTVQWRLKPKGINSSEYKLMTKEELQKEGLDYIEKLKNEGEEIEEIIELEDKLIIKLKD